MKFRYSAISTAHTCMQKYKLQYVDQVKTEGVPDIDLEFGTAMHSAMAATMEGVDPFLIFALYWDTLRDKPMATGQRSWKDLSDLGRLFLLKFERLHKKHFKPFKIEETISGNIGGHDIGGTPDYLGDYKGIASVVDFKTSNYSYRKERIKVNEQMPIYAELSRQVYGYQPQQLVYIVFNKRDASIQVHIQKITKRLLTNALNNAILVMSDLAVRKEFPKNPNSCTMGANYKCPYFDTCHKGIDDD